MNKFKGLLCLVLCLAVIIMIPVSSFAATSGTQTFTYDGITYTIQILTDSKTTKSVDVHGNGEDSVVTLDKSTKNLTIKSTVNGVTKTYKSNLKASTTTTTSTTAAATSQAVAKASSTVIGSGAEMWWGHNYTIFKSGSTFSWYTVQKPSNYKNTIETTNNKDDLNGFKDDVNSAFNNQLAADAAIGVGAASAIAGALGALETAGIATIIGLLLAAGASITAGVYFLGAWNACRDADYHFARY